LSEVISSQDRYPAELKTTAANYLAPYLHSKYGTKIPPRYILEPVTLPHPEPTSLEQTNTNINFISAGLASGTIDLDFGQFLITSQHTIANHLIAEEELKLKLAGSPLASKEQTIRIEGGLPPLPGTNVIMPEVNGAYGQHSTLNGHSGVTIEHQPAEPLPAATPDTKP
jgi:hypothetical protein